MLVVIIAALGTAGFLVLLLVQIRANRWLHRRVEDLELKVQRIEAEQEVDCILAEVHRYPRTVRRRLRFVRGGLLGILLLIALYWRQILAWVQAKPMPAAGIVLAGAGVATAVAMPFTVNPSPPHGQTPAVAQPPNSTAIPPSARPHSRRSSQAPTRGPTPTTSPPPPEPSAVPADDPTGAGDPARTHADSPPDVGGGDTRPSTNAPTSSPPATSQPPESGGRDGELCLDVLIVGVCVGRSDHG